MPQEPPDGRNAPVPVTEADVDPWEEMPRQVLRGIGTTKITSQRRHSQPADPARTAPSPGTGPATGSPLPGGSASASGGSAGGDAVASPDRGSATGQAGAWQEKRLARRPEGPAHKRASGLGATLKRTFSEFKEDNGTDWAAALTYYGVLSMFPALIALISIVGLVGDPRTITENLTKLAADLGPATAADTLRGPIEGLTSNSGTAGILLIAGLLAALWSASGYIGAFTRAANIIYETEEGRPFYKLRPLQLFVTLLQVLLLALVALALVVTGPVAQAVGSAFGIGDTAVLVWDLAKWPGMIAVVLAAVALLYYASPNAKLRGFRSVLPGAMLAVTVWILASAGFAYYVANFGSYNKTYGTLGGVITFLVWLWLTNIAVVLGAQFNAERERSREFRDGIPSAERELQMPLRHEPRPKKRSRTG
jgi:membrane protein